MSHDEEVVELLGALAQSDRGWIIERLSPAAKARLAERIASDEALRRDSQQPSAERELKQCMARIAAAEASSMLCVLRDEPGWLIKAVLGLSDWPWRKKFVQSLPSGMRIDVAGEWANEPSLGGSARSRLLRELSGRLAALPPENRPESRFAVLLARATGKVKRP